MGDTLNNMTQPAVPNNSEVDTLIVEKFLGVVHTCYTKGENLLSGFKVQEVVGTNLVTEKFIGETEVQTLTPGQSPEPTETEFNKNSLVVDTIVLSRNTLHSLHQVQNDFELMSKLADNQMAKLKQVEDQMVIQQLLTGGATGGEYNPVTSEITGGIRRVKGQGVAVKLELNSDGSQAEDPYQLMSAIQLVIEGLIIQRTPIMGMRIVVPVSEFNTLVDYKYVAQIEGGSNEMEGEPDVLMGKLRGYNIPIMGSVEFTQMKINPHDGKTHHVLSNAQNNYRYDVTDDMKKANAVIYREDALLCGRTIALQGDIFFDKMTKGNYIDTWFSEGAIPNRFDNIGIVESTKTGDNAPVKVKAAGKATATKTY